MATRDENFVNGNQFDPDRWLAVRSEGYCPHERQAFIPFGAGPRLCPGLSLALLEIRMVLSMLCRNFDLEPVDGGDAVEERLAFSMMPDNLRVVLKRRAGF